jgi:hypothetical protein
MMDCALRDCIISATPLAKTTTRDAVKDAGVESEIDLT